MNTNATPAEQLAQSLNTQGFEAEAFHPAPGKYGQGKVLVHCPIPERFW